MKNSVAILFSVKEIAFITYQNFQTLNLACSDGGENWRVPMSIPQFN